MSSRDLKPALPISRARGLHHHIIMISFFCYHGVCGGSRQGISSLNCLLELSLGPLCLPLIRKKWSKCPVTSYSATFVGWVSLSCPREAPSWTVKGKQGQVRKTMSIMVGEGHCMSCNPALQLRPGSILPTCIPMKPESKSYYKFLTFTKWLSSQPGK